ncbi:nitroreductase [Listeria weihenstephanensis FSL R9-0317]|uniref:Nitroreductase n=1 Tax=Listeria weihenstephanensis TaxID=1006155 RepID=A0A1S7FXD1_9LIST|nr:nitroreductase family protein [Listeria weihenstephanensis]AQY52083.1 nitroreductase [Listeria weihenstephanensis]EUJ37257.1 nitroreductase [Listeria weihenstephanensis FSL R9-0317]
MTKNIAEIITERRSIKRVDEAPIDRAVINDILEKAAFAPFHSKVEPWHVAVLSKEAEKRRFVNAIVNSMERMQGEPLTRERREQIKDGNERKIVAPPYTLIVTTDIIGSGKKDFEAIAATSAFIQNIQLLAWEAGLGVLWRTNNFIFDSEVVAELGLDGQQIVGCLQITQFNEIPDAKPRRPLSEWVKDLD